MLLLQFIAVIVAFTLRKKADAQLHTRLINSLGDYERGNPDIVREWNRLQQQWSCCGVDNSTDWTDRTTMKKQPDSCCLNNNCDSSTGNHTGLFPSGCYGAARSLFFRYSNALGGVTLFFFFVEILGLILAIVLLRDLKNNYGSV